MDRRFREGGFDRKLFNGLAALACGGLLGYALYAQHGLGLEPCPLCVFQRVATIGLGAAFLLAFLHNPAGWGARVYALLIFAAAAIGAIVAVLVLGFTFLIAYVHNPGRRGARVYGFVAAVVAGAGMLFAGRQLWLQNLPPDQVPACGPGIDYIMSVFPLREAVAMVFEGSGDCAKVDWTFLGLSMAGWVLISLGVLALFALWNNFRRA